MICTLNMNTSNTNMHYLILIMQGHRIHSFIIRNFNSIVWTTVQQKLQLQSQNETNDY